MKTTDDRGDEENRKTLLSNIVLIYTNRNAIMPIKIVYSIRIYSEYYLKNTLKHELHPRELTRGKLKMFDYFFLDIAQFVLEV